MNNKNIFRGLFACLIGVGCFITQHAVSAAAQHKPSFDCSKASSAAEKLICKTSVLAELDQEMSRLYHLAVTGKSLTPARKKELIAFQTGWIKGRNDCWKSKDLKACITNEYVQRIHQLRQGYAESRKADKQGFSSGPWVLECRPFDALIGMTRVNASQHFLFLEWKNHQVTLSETKSGSQQYQGKDFAGNLYNIAFKHKVCGLVVSV